MHTVHMKLLLASVTLNCFCASADVWTIIFGPRLKSYGISLETENTTYNGVKELTKKYDYPLETHTVVNKQGYILTLHRLPYGRKSINKKRLKPVVLLHVGLFGSPECFLFRGPQKDLPYILADSGYDVWIINNRGNSYSKQHIKLNPEVDRSFWDFSFHDLAVDDMPVIIDYILDTSKTKHLFFIGYSMGSTIGYILCSIKPEYNSKIKHFINLAPSTDVLHKLTPAHGLIFSTLPGIWETLNRQNILDIFPRRTTTADILQNICQNGSMLQPICIAMIFLFVGVDYKQLNPDIIPYIVKYFPDGASLKTVQHYTQLIASGVFKQYDYGVGKNNIMYGSDIPPMYNLSKVTTPVSIYYGGGDFMVTQTDCEFLAERLPNVVGLYKIPFPEFNHMDFMWARDVRRLLYEPLVVLLNKYKYIA